MQKTPLRRRRCGEEYGYHVMRVYPYYLGRYEY